MSEALKRAGILYGKIGLNTPRETIGARLPAIAAAGEAVSAESIPELVGVMLGTHDAEDAGFLEHFRADPTFDVRPADKEAALLATAISDHAMIESRWSGELALAILTASVGGMRSFSIPSDILTLADEALTANQVHEVSKPSKLKKVPIPAAITENIAELKGINAMHSFLPQIMNSLTSLIDRISAHTVTMSGHIATANNGMLDYIAKLEDEMRAHWWIVGGLSYEADGFFKDMKIEKAAAIAGWELAGKHSGNYGLHAAPALLDLVIEKGRAKLPDITLSDVPKSIDLAWRKKTFEPISSSPVASHLPLSTMLGLAAGADDEEDWKPAFKRKTGLDADVKVKPLYLAVQFYRERLAHKFLSI
ncbi:GTPase-associated system all-helical protein GASH [Novosphingobium sp. B-7]|uniref:GTPase-associated system all-helical protein GASH n=1 Tax=Novosphingobium sp. B-7 TaxID=1298855 RepID=UPI0003B5578F|nr:GTPase-associated system all-helical protein GASH [Novosphingobium sp. B-7]